MIKNNLFSNGKYIIYQNEKSLSMNLDSFLLADFVDFNNRDLNIIEFGCATGVITMYIALKKARKIIGIDINNESIMLLNKAAKYNGISDLVKGYPLDIKNINKHYIANTFDVIICNPPYYKTGKQTILTGDSKHENMISLDNVIEKSQYLLKNSGKLFLILPVSRLDELFLFTSKYNFKIKELRMVHSFVNKEARVVLIKLIKNAKIGLKVLKPLIVYKQLNCYNDEVLKIFKGSD